MCSHLRLGSAPCSMCTHEWTHRRNAVSDEEIVEIGHRALRDNLARTLEQTVKQGRFGLVPCRNVPDGYLVPADRYNDLRAAENRERRLVETLPLLLAAARAGAAI